GQAGVLGELLELGFERADPVEVGLDAAQVGAVLVGQLQGWRRRGASAGREHRRAGREKRDAEGDPQQKGAAAGKMRLGHGSQSISSMLRASTSRLPTWLAGLTTPSFSMRSMMRAARL